METSTILRLYFKDSQIGTYSREDLSAIFHLLRNLLQDLPTETEIPLVDYLQSDFEQVLKQYRNALINQQPLQLTAIQQTLAHFLLSPDKTSIKDLILENDVELLRWVLSQQREHLQCSRQDVASAASRGHLECLQILHQNGCPWDFWTCAYAAEYGHLDCLQYALENGCPLDE